jgi:hypothetical protein
MLGESVPATAHQMIIEFDLECEAWRPAASLRGPLINLLIISLAELQGHLVAGYDDRRTATELWFLVDSDRCIWSKRYTITMPHHQVPFECDQFFQKPLALLDDGRILMCMRLLERGGFGTFDDKGVFLRIYDPRTKTFLDGTVLRDNNHVTGVFTWNLLHTERRGALDRVAKKAVINKR